MNNRSASPEPGSNPAVLAVERNGHIATVFLDRPEKRNAMGMPFFSQLPTVMAELGSDEQTRAVVIAAKGPAFSVGLDLAALGGIGEGENPESRTEVSRAALARRTHAQVVALQSSISAVADCQKPVLAAIHGWCIGGGVDLASACDIRLCSADAVFSVRETRMAMVADLGSLQRLPDLMAYGYVAELAFTGKDIDANRAEKMGLVNEVLPDRESALAAALSMAAEISANSPLAVQGAKAVLAEARRSRIEAGLRFVATWNAGRLHSDDLSEAVAAFFERRPPTFSGS
ncbi:MAG: crotonase/enoyl-CoA hydratase family protein [Acidimicrobiales bacterium]